MAETQQKMKSWVSKILGRGIVEYIFGHFFENKNNTASILAVILVVTLCIVTLHDTKAEYINGLLNIVFVIIGYYFGAKQSKVSNEVDEQ